ncbi:MAG: CoA-binding protein [Pelosinus sp.]|nr:CoA-binding protein [Pelosinus sp.]
MDIVNMLKAKIWAVVGATAHKEKFGYKIFKVMTEAGFEVYPVNPGLDEVQGKKCYAKLADLPVLPEAVNIVVPPRVGTEVVRQCAELGIKKIWLQPGSENTEVMRLAEKLGLEVVCQSCIMIELRKAKG